MRFLRSVQTAEQERCVLKRARVGCRLAGLGSRGQANAALRAVLPAVVAASGRFACPFGAACILHRDFPAHFTGSALILARAGDQSHLVLGGLYGR